MSLSSSVLKTAIKNNIKAKEGFDNFDDGSMGVIIDAICDEIISHIQANAVVTTVVTGTLPAGPVAAAGTGGIT